MSKSNHFVTLLKKSHEQHEETDSIVYTLFENINNRTETKEMSKATHVQLMNHTFKLTDPSGYKEHDVLSILFFYENRLTEHASYLQQCLVLGSKIGRDLASVSFIDRRDLFDFLTGVKDKSNNVRTFVPLRPESTSVPAASTRKFCSLVHADS